MITVPVRRNTEYFIRSFGQAYAVQTDAITMQDITTKHMPTGISSLDPVLEGGAPPGSMMLLLGDAGAGTYEFVYSSVANLLNLKKEGVTSPSVVLPAEILYITFTRLKDDVKNEILQSFHPDMTANVGEQVVFRDLSESYFDASVVPHNWYSDIDVVTRLQQRSEHESLLVHLARVLDASTPGSLIVLDSVTDIATQCAAKDRWNTLAGFLRGLQRISKRWNSNIFLILTQGILEQTYENELADIADAVLYFQWEETKGERRQRVLYFDKFRGLMTRFEEKDIVKFKIKITFERGFEVESIRVVI